MEWTDPTISPTTVEERRAAPRRAAHDGDPVDPAESLGPGHLLTTQSCQQDGTGDPADPTRVRSVPETMKPEEKQP